MDGPERESWRSSSSRPGSATAHVSDGPTSSFSSSAAGTTSQHAPSASAALSGASVSATRWSTTSPRASGAVPAPGLGEVPTPVACLRPNCSPSSTTIKRVRSRRRCRPSRRRLGPHRPRGIGRPAGGGQHIQCRSTPPSQSTCSGLSVSCWRSSASSDTLRTTDSTLSSGRDADLGRTGSYGSPIGRRCVPTHSGQRTVPAAGRPVTTRLLSRPGSRWFCRAGFAGRLGRGGRRDRGCGRRFAATAAGSAGWADRPHGGWCVGDCDLAGARCGGRFLDVGVRDPAATAKASSRRTPSILRRRPTRSRLRTSTWGWSPEATMVASTSAISATVRFRFASSTGAPVFIGIAHESDVEQYLAGVAHDEIDQIHFGPFRVTYRLQPGGPAATPPSSQRFWAASAQGPGLQRFEWDVRSGRWASWS